MLKKILSTFSKSKESDWRERPTQSSLSKNKSTVNPDDPKSLACFIGGLIVSLPSIDTSVLLDELKSLGVSDFNATKSIALTQEAFGHALIKKQNGQPPTKATFISLKSHNKVEIDLLKDPTYLAAFEVANQEVLYDSNRALVIANRGSVGAMLSMAANGHFKIENISIAPPMTYFETLDEFESEES